MDAQQQLTAQLRQWVSAYAEWPRIAEGLVLSTTDTHCVVELLSNGLKVPHVALGAGVRPEGMIGYPKKGSRVWVAWHAQDASPVILATEALERLSFTKNKTQVVLSEGIQLRAQQRIRIENGTQSLATILLDLLTMVATLTVGTGSGPSSPPNPSTQTKIAHLKTRIKNLLA